ncbi:hypothetical protein QFC22_000152 [Naganishia vaughanmartiniae]|uniref:Uncharacterized protein n=1 Tax=Naganishia vaughanmartiniae TaxID=1424756 RepID=A0ACC2XMJ3_9TREE|nr:hypothetical protein QFC22_000152 [Naganishia vaughanmartiniae]
MAAPNDESQQPEGLATGSQQQVEGFIAEGILKDVMEEQAFQDLNAKLETLENELARERKEKEEAIAGKNQLAVINAQLEEANKRAQASYVSISGALRESQTRIELLEQEKGELAQDYSRLKQKSKNDDDLVQKYKERIESDTRQIKQLDIERNEAELAKSKFQHQHSVLTSALDTARRDVEVYTKALMDKESEFSKYRTDHYLELQATMAERDRESQARVQAESAKRTLENQYRLNADRLNKAQEEIQELKNQLNSKTLDFKSDASFLQQRITDLQNQSKSDREKMDELEMAMRDQAEKYQAEEQELQQKLSAARAQQEESHVKMQEMAKMVELLGADRAAGTGGSISATADLTLALQGGNTDSRTVRQALADAVVLQGQVERLQLENSKLENICKTVLQEINERKPALDRQRAEWEAMKEDCSELSSQLAEVTDAKRALESRLAELQQSHNASVDDNKVLQRQVSDLSLQLRNILRQLAIRDDPALAFEQFDPVDGSLKDESDIDLVITNSLVMFKKLPELLELNKRLLQMTRSLGQELEKREHYGGVTEANGNMGDLEEAANVIQDLTRKVQELEADALDSEAQVSLVTKERDMFSRMLVQGRLLGMPLEQLQSEDNSTVQGVLQTIRAEFEHHREDLQQKLTSVQTLLDEKSSSLKEESSKLADALSSLRHEQNQNQMLVQKQAQDGMEISSHLETIAKRESEINNLRMEIRKLSDESNVIRQEKSSLQSLLASANAQRKLLEANDKALDETVSRLTAEKADLDRQLKTRQFMVDQQVHAIEEAKASVESANRTLRADLSDTKAEELSAAQQRVGMLENAAASMETQHADALKALQAELESQKTQTEVQKAELESQKALTKEQEEKARNALSIGLRHQRALNDMRNVTIPGLKAAHDKTVAELRAEVESLTSQLNAMKTQLESAHRDLTRLQGDVSSRDTQIQELNSAVERLNAASSGATPLDTSDASQAIQRDLEAARQRITELETEVAKAAQGSLQGGADSKAEGLESRLRVTAAELEAANKKVQNVQNSMVSSVEVKLIWKSTAYIKLVWQIASQSESQRVIAELSAKFNAAQAETQRLSQRIQELEAQATSQTTRDQTAENSGSSDSAVDAAVLKNLQAEYDAYKISQNEKYKDDVKKVNDNNKKLRRDQRELRALRNKLESLLSNVATNPTLTAIEISQQAKQALEEASKENQHIPTEDFTAPKEESVQTDPIENAHPTSPAAQRGSESLDVELQQLKAQLEEAKTLAESRMKEVRAADEKAKKLAVKATMTDRLKQQLNDLKVKYSELQSAQAATAAAPTAAVVAVPTLSVKGGANPQAVNHAISADDGIDILGAGAKSATAAATDASSQAIATGGASPSAMTTRSVSVRGRGMMARGTATRARVRAGVRPATRPINPQAILSQVDAQFRGNDNTANTMQVKRPAPADGSASNNDSDEGSKRPKLNEQDSSKNGQA